MNKKRVILILLASIVAFAGYGYFSLRSAPAIDENLQEISNGDAQFWLMQGEPNNRFIPCTVYYHFDKPLDEVVVLTRLKNLVASYEMFQRNVVEVNGMPYWQSSEPDWTRNFRILDAEDDIEAIREKADAELSRASIQGQGIPLFRAYLTSDRKQLIFMWHHVISDYEGMFNKHASHLFLVEGERTRFGYQIKNENAANSNTSNSTPSPKDLLRALVRKDRPLGFTGTDFEVKKIILPINDYALHSLGQKADLPMSDIFSFITLRAVTAYHEDAGESGQRIRPVVSPLSLRQNAMANDEGNNRAIKTFPVVFPLEEVKDMHRRIVALQPAATSYDAAGKAMKTARRWPISEPALRRLGMPDYISNYFPLADMPLNIDGVTLISHDLRVPMVPFERSKFAWSNYNGEIQLYLHIDRELIDTERLVASFDKASREILQFLKSYSEGGADS